MSKLSYSFQLGIYEGPYHGHDLAAVFQEINLRHFDGFLTAPDLRWNSRLRSSAGRFIPGSRRYGSLSPGTIEVAAYLPEETNAAELIRDTVAHEMIHYWLWIRRQPYGHTPEFYAKMHEMGVSRYNPVPRNRPYRYVYVCGGCSKEFYARRRLRPLACAVCCRLHANGTYDARFRLMLHRELDPREALELLAKASRPLG